MSSVEIHKNLTYIITMLDPILLNAIKDVQSYTSGHS